MPGLGTARFDARPPDDLDRHLNDLDVPLQRNPPSKTFVRSVRKPANMVVGRPTVDFTLEGVPVTMLMTRAEPGSHADRLECEQFLFLLEGAFQHFSPDVLLTYGGHSVVQEAMSRAKRRGVVTVFTLRNYGYDDRQHFEHVDHVFTCSPYLSECLSAADRPAEHGNRITNRMGRGRSARRDATVSSPSSTRRWPRDRCCSPASPTCWAPSVPISPSWSCSPPRAPGLLNDIPGLDFGKYPHIMAAPATPRPADFFALTRILLVPSAFHEPFGRVAAEALINGIPPLVSDRGALPETVRGAGRVLPLPAWLTEKTKELPTVEEAQPWFDAVCELWDDEHAYAEASALARATASRCYSEPIMRQRYLDYFASLDHPAPLFNEA